MEIRITVKEHVSGLEIGVLDAIHKEIQAILG
jgi:hypothetical protein